MRLKYVEVFISGNSMILMVCQSFLIASQKETNNVISLTWRRETHPSLKTRVISVPADDWNAQVACELEEHLHD